MSLRKAVLVDRDPELLTRLTSELEAGGVAVETLDSTQGLTPDLLALAAPNWLVVDAELPGLSRAALLVLMRSMKSRFPLMSAVVTTAGQPQDVGSGFDLVVPRAVLLSEGARAVGIAPARLQSLDVRAIIDGVLGARPSAETQRFEASLDLFSEHNFWLGRSGGASVIGVFIATAVLPPVGQTVSVRLQLMGRETIEATGEVGWQRTRKSLAHRQPSGVGIKLTSLSDTARRSIERFLELREPFLWTA